MSTSSGAPGPAERRPRARSVPELTALEAESGDHRVSSLMSDIYVSQGQIDYAIWSLERALQKAEAAGDAAAQANTLVKLGTLQRSLGRDSQGTASFEQAVAIDPSSWEAQYNLGVSYLEAGQTRAALAPLERAQQLGGDREVYLALAAPTTCWARTPPRSVTPRRPSAAWMTPTCSRGALHSRPRALPRRRLHRRRPRTAPSADARPNDPQVQLWSGLGLTSSAIMPPPFATSARGAAEPQQHRIAREPECRLPGRAALLRSADRLASSSSTEPGR